MNAATPAAGDILPEAPLIHPWGEARIQQWTKIALSEWIAGMKIGYANRRLEKICNKRKEASKHLSGIKPELLFLRIGQLAAFDNLGQIPFQSPPLHFHPLRENFAGAYGVTLQSLTRIVFKPAGDFERRGDGTAIEKTVTEITILSIGDYHQCHT